MVSKFHMDIFKFQFKQKIKIFSEVRYSHLLIIYFVATQRQPNVDVFFQIL